MEADPATIGASLFAILAGAWGAWQQRNASKAKEEAVIATDVATKVSSADLANSQQALADSYKEMANDWKGRFEISHKELVEYREYVHEKAKKDTEQMLRLTEENADLRARTDLTPIVEQLKQQQQVQVELGSTLGKLAQAVTTLVDRVSEIEVIKRTNTTT